jgi:hypothetical protein
MLDDCESLRCLSTGRGLGVKSHDGNAWIRLGDQRIMSVFLRWPSLRIVWFSLAMGAVLVLRTGESAKVNQADPTWVLRNERGLRKISGGNVWLLPDEFRLQRLLSDLDPLHRQILAQQQSLQQAAARNQVLWETNRQRIEALRRALSETETDSTKKQQIEQQIRELEKQAVEPREWFAVPDIRRRLIELTDLRLRLLLSVLEIRRLHPELMADYASLAEDETVSRALEQLGPDHRLGPLRQEYHGQWKRLEQLEGVVSTDWLPIYRQSGQIRFGGLLEDRVPVTFSWQESYEPTVLAASMVQAAGVVVPEDSPRVPLVLAGRSLTARRIQITSLRLGSARLVDIPVLVLPADAEDLGAWIGREGFGEYAVEIQPERWRLTIDSGQ